MLECQSAGVASEAFKAFQALQGLPALGSRLSGREGRYLGGSRGEARFSTLLLPPG